jgi:copper chaperone CopZ
MKTIIVIFVLCLAGILPGRCAVWAQDVQSSPVIVVQVHGLVCDFCAQALQKTFRKRPEVQETKVDLTKKTVTIILRKGQNLDDDTIRKLVTNSGYTVVEILRSQDHDQKQ